MKHSLPFFIAILVALSLAGCGEVGDRAAPASPQSAEPPEVDSTATLSGAIAYDQACARCHEDGINGAPRTGHPEDWAERSPLWEAVLFEHAKTGWLDMPARGGVQELDDATVMKAAEHMLTVTFPDAKANPILP